MKNFFQAEQISWDASIKNELDSIRIRFTDKPSSFISQVENSLVHYGFALISGLSQSNQKSDAAEQLLYLSQQLGTVLHQSPRKELIEDIRDFSDTDAKDERGYRSKGELTPHSDPPTLITLHCLKEAKSGGESYLINVRCIHDAIKKSHPELLEVLFQGFPYWIVDGQSEGPGPSKDDRPVFMIKDNRVSCVIYRPFIDLAAKALHKPLTTMQLKALDIFEFYTKHDDFALRFTLKPGETIILHNRTVLHARTDYEDWPDAEKRRHLLRTWIDATELLPVSSEHELGDIFI